MKTIIPLNLPQKKGVISGYASFFNIIDQKGDQVVRGAFSKTLRAWRLLGKMPKMLWQHDVKCPIGVWTHLAEDENGLYAEGCLSLGVKQADEAYLLMKGGAIDGLSIGFRTIEAVQGSDRKTRCLIDIDLIEISLVTFGANAKATASVKRR